MFVPTCIYGVVNAFGPLSIIEDFLWLRTHLGELTFQQENKRPVPWAVDDAPNDYIARQLKGIVGMEMPISRIEGKWKVSQNKKDQDRMGVSRGLNFESGGVPSAMSDLVDRYGS